MQRQRCAGINDRQLALLQHHELTERPHHQSGRLPLQRQRHLTDAPRPLLAAQMHHQQITLRRRKRWRAGLASLLGLVLARRLLQYVQHRPVGRQHRKARQWKRKVVLLVGELFLLGTELPNPQRIAAGITAKRINRRRKSRLRRAHPVVEAQHLLPR
jgi:hypothetical protein